MTLKSFECLRFQRYPFVIGNHISSAVILSWVNKCYYYYYYIIIIINQWLKHQHLNLFPGAKSPLSTLSIYQTFASAPQQQNTTQFLYNLLPPHFFMLFNRFLEYSNAFGHNCESFKLATAFLLLRLLTIHNEESWGEFLII